MQGLWIFLVFVVWLLQAEGRPCRYWCKTQEDHFYCCPSGRPKATEKRDSHWSSKEFWLHLVGSIMQFQWREPKEHEEEDSCPPVRPTCPRQWESSPPKLCFTDGSCTAWEKCCYDICIDEKVCKPAE